MAANIDLEIRKFSKALKNVEDTNFKAINKNIGESLRNSTLDRFKKQEDHNGKKWTKRKYGNSKKRLLMNTGTLRKSIKVKVDEKMVHVGTNLEYASTHQFGAKNRRIKAKKGKYLKFKVGNKWITKKDVKINVPARPFLGISEDDKKEIRNILCDYLEEAIK